METVASRTEVETGAWQNRAMLEGVRTKVEPEGRRSPVEPKGWRAEVQPEAKKSVAKLER